MGAKVKLMLYIKFSSCKVMSDRPNIFGSRFFEKNGNGVFLVRMGSNMKMVNGKKFRFDTLHAHNRTCIKRYGNGRALVKKRYVTVYKIR